MQAKQRGRGMNQSHNNSGTGSNHGWDTNRSKGTNKLRDWKESERKKSWVGNETNSPYDQWNQSIDLMRDQTSLTSPILSPPTPIHLSLSLSLWPTTKSPTHHGDERRRDGSKSIKRDGKEEGEESFALFSSAALLRAPGKVGRLAS
jgi:hypothetical protein